MAEEFERIVREFQDKIFRLAYSMLLDRAAAEETTQDVLLRVWKGLPGFRAESSLSTWIYSITRNACLTARGRGAIHAVSLDEPAPLREVERRAQPPGQARGLWMRARCSAACRPSTGRWWRYSICRRSRTAKWRPCWACRWGR